MKRTIRIYSVGVIIVIVFALLMSLITKPVHAQELTTTALDQFGTYVEYEMPVYDIPLVPPLYMQQPLYAPPVPYMQQPVYTVELAQPPGYNTWGPYWVPPFDYNLYVPQVPVYQPYLPVQPIQHSPSYHILLNILNNR